MIYPKVSDRRVLEPLEPRGHRLVPRGPDERIAIARLGQLVGRHADAVMDTPEQLGPYFITTAIPYVNARPHIGFAMELVLADVMARSRALPLQAGLA